MNQDKNGCQFCKSKQPPKPSAIFRLVEWGKAFLVVLVILLLYRIVQNIAPQTLNFQSQRITYGFSFLIGLTASVSSCLATIGSLVIVFAQKYKGNGKNFFQNALNSNLLFHAGRLITFFSLGGILGLIGREISLSSHIAGIISFGVAMIMGWLGLHIIGIAPSISSLGIPVPKKITKKWAELSESKRKSAPLLLGGLSFFLPCGFTQSMQIFAMASGNFWVGAVTMFLFALGTVPVLLAMGITSTWTKIRGIAFLQKSVGIIVVVFAFFTAQSAIALINMDNKAPAATTEKSTAKLSENTDHADWQVVRMEVTPTGFKPNVIKIKKDIPVRWIVKGDRASGCTNKIIVPSLGISQEINKGDNIIVFTPTNEKEIPFSCWMGMVRGKFITE